MLNAETRGFFDGAGPVVVGRAPGRLDVMGGIADYSGALVLEGLIAAEARVAVQARPDGVVRVWTLGPEAAGLAHPIVELPVGALYDAAGATPRSLHELHHLLAEQDAIWAGYVIGCMAIVAAEGLLAGPLSGANLLVHSTVPLGAGVSSSAALEVAAMRAIDALWDLRLPGLRLARLCQMVENQVVGAPCGIMDQVTCALGRAGHLLALRCQPHHLEGYVRLPAGAMILGLDSGVKHSVRASRYTRTRVATFMGRAIIRRAAGAAVPFYLAALTAHDYRTLYRELLPETMRGAEFLERFGDHEDPATDVEPAVAYAVRGCAEHPIYENARVERFARILGRAGHAADAARRRQHLSSAGGLMYDSHHSYGSRAGLGAPETDLLVRLVRRRGTAAGLYGAKITGGGSGGTVAVLAEDDARAMAAIGEVMDEYSRETGIMARLIVGTALGAYETVPEWHTLE